MLTGVAPEMGKGPFMGLKKLCQPLIGTGVVEPTAAETQRQHEHMHDLRAGSEAHQRLAPINLTLLARRRLKAEERSLGLHLDFAEWRDTPLHRLVTAGVAAARPQLLVQNSRQVIDPMDPVIHKLGMGGEKCIRHYPSMIGLPCRLSQTTTHGLAIKVQPPRNL